MKQTLGQWLSGEMPTITMKSPPDGHEFYGNQYTSGAGGGDASNEGGKSVSGIHDSRGNTLLPGSKVRIVSDNEIDIEHGRSKYTLWKPPTIDHYFPSTKNGKPIQHIEGYTGFKLEGDKLIGFDASTYSYDEKVDQRVRAVVESMRK